MVEGFARKIIGGFAGKLGKKFLGKSAANLTKGATGKATESAFSFASNYAIGQLAHRYYANGRSWSGIDATRSSATLKDKARKLHDRHLPQIREPAGSLDAQRVVSMVHG